jgi:hypothetical protein
MTIVEIAEARITVEVITTRSQRLHLKRVLVKAMKNPLVNVVKIQHFWANYFVHNNLTS